MYCRCWLVLYSKYRHVYLVTGKSHEPFLHLNVQIKPTGKLLVLKKVLIFLRAETWL